MSAVHQELDIDILHCWWRLKTFPGKVFSYGVPTYGLFLKQSAFEELKIYWLKKKIKCVIIDTKKTELKKFSHGQDAARGEKSDSFRS